MIDSWMPRKLEPGLAATYSRLSALSTSTMKSPPGRSVVTTSASSEGSVSRGATGALAGATAAGACGVAWAPTAAAPPTRAAPVTAALFRKSRRSTDPFFAISLSSADLKARRYVHDRIRRDVHDRSGRPSGRPAVAYNSQRFMAMRFVRTALFGLLTVATITAAFAQGNRPTQTADEFRRMLAMGTKYRTASEFYTALKTAAPGGGRQMPAFAQLPDWSGLWMASGGGNFFSPGPGGTAP